MKSHRSEHLTSSLHGVHVHPSWCGRMSIVYSSLLLQMGYVGTQGYSLFLIQSIPFGLSWMVNFFFCLVFLKVITALTLFVFGCVWLCGDLMLHLPETVVLGNPLETLLLSRPSLQWLPCHQHSQSLACNQS